MNDRPVHDPTGVELVALDIDGTLVNWNGYLSPAVLQAVGRLDREPRVNLVLATGRSVHSTIGMAQQFGIECGWAVCSNGSVVVRLDPTTEAGWTVERQVTFDPAPALDAIARLLPTAKVAVEEVGRGFLVSEHFPVGELDGQVQVVTLAELASRPATRVILRETDMSPAMMSQIIEASQLREVTYAVGWTGWIDLNPPGVTKASALEWLRGWLGVAPENTVAVGDGGNDFGMLKWASRGVAMGNASPELKAVASEVAGTCEDDGVVSVIESVLAGLS